MSAITMVVLTVYCGYIENRDFEKLKSESTMVTLREVIYVSAGLGVIAFAIGVKGAFTQHTPALIVSVN